MANIHSMDSMDSIHSIDETRVATMIRAIELDVDGDEFDFRCDEERSLWPELQTEFQERAAREGRSWVALDAVA